MHTHNIWSVQFLFSISQENYAGRRTCDTQWETEWIPSVQIHSQRRGHLFGLFMGHCTVILIKCASE